MSCARSGGRPSSVSTGGSSPNKHGYKMRRRLSTILNHGIFWHFALLTVMIVAKVLGLVGWPWHLVLIPLWLPLVIGAVLMTLAKLGLCKIDPGD